MRTGLATDIQARGGHYVWKILTGNRVDVLRQGRTFSRKQAKEQAGKARVEILKSRGK